MDWRPIAATSALLIGGACASWPYARTHEAPPAVTESAVPPPASGLEIPSIAVEAQSGQAVELDTAPVAPAAWHHPTPIVLPSDATLPKMSRSPSERAAHLQSPDFPAAEVTPEQPRPVTTGPRRKHRIVDGDSLRLIALRYFGDASRATEIAEINRDVIADPGLLPVGVEIVIPADAAEIER